MRLLLLLMTFATCSIGSLAFPLVTQSIRLKFKNEVELKEAIKEVVKTDEMASLLDNIGHTKVELLLTNDYNFHNFVPITPPDDIGMTHGFKLIIQHDLTSIDQKGYIATLTYETNLYTNSTQPEQFQKDYFQTLYFENGVAVGDVYFKEENLFGLIISKAKTNDAYYWSLQGGYHELNSQDIERPLIVSAITQQSYWHAYRNSDRAIYREYNYLPGDESSQGVYIQGGIELDRTIKRTGDSRSFTRFGANARATMIEGASYVGAYLQLGKEYDSKNYSTRLLGGVDTKIYQSRMQNIVFFEVARGGDDITVKLKISKPLNGDPDYLNPFPHDFPNREETFLPNETRFELGISGKFDKN